MINTFRVHTQSLAGVFKFLVGYMTCSIKDISGIRETKEGFEIADWYKYIWIVALIIASQLSFVSGVNR